MLIDLTVLQANVLALVGWADGQFHESERAAFRDLLEASPGNDALKANLFGMTDKPPNKNQVLKLVASSPREMAAAAIKSAFVLAKADSHLHETELALLFDLGQAAGVSANRSADFLRMLETHLASVDLERDLFGT